MCLKWTRLKGSSAFVPWRILATMCIESGLPCRQIITLDMQSPSAAAAGVHNDFRGDWDAAQNSRTAMSHR
jgi:hypothetical protein